MSDQIIIEFIGDPSGLKPAEEALRGLGKSSQDTIAAFEKANTAAKHFAEGAKEAATAVKSTGEAAEKSVKALSSLSQAISGGAVKAVAEDFKNWAKEIADLGVKKGELKQKLSEVTSEMAKAKAEMKANETSYAALGKEAKGLVKDMNSTAASMDKYGEQSAKAAAKNIELNEKLEKARTTLTAMNGTSEEGSTKYNKLVASVEKYSTEIAKNDKAISDNAAKMHVLGDTNRGLAQQYDTVKSKMEIAGTAADHSKSRYAALGKESKTLKGEIAAVDIELAHASKSFGSQSKAAEKSTKSHSAFIDQTKKLVGALTELGATTAAAAGKEEEASAIREKGAQTIDALTKLQSVATGATELFGESMKAASLTSKALGQAARGAWAEATLGLSEVIQLIVTVVQHFDEIKAKFEAFAGAMRKLFGMPEVKDHATILKENITSYQQQNDKLEKQIGLMQAQGASAEQIARVQKEQLDTQHKMYEVQLELAREKNDEKAIQEAQKKLDENRLALIRNKKELEEAHLETMKEEGASEKDILLAKKGQNDAALKENEAALQYLKTQVAILGTNNMLTTGMKEQIQLLEHQNKVLKAQGSEIKQGLADQAKEETEHRKDVSAKALADKKALIDAQLAAAKAGSAEEQQLRIKQAEIDAEIEKQAAGYQAGIVTAVNDKLKKQKLEINNEYHLQKLQQDKLGLEHELFELAQKGADTLQKQKEIFEKERQLVSDNVKLTAQEKQRELDNIAAAEKAVLDSRISAIRTNDKQELEDSIKTNQEKLKDEKLTADQRTTINKNILAAQMKLEIDAVTASGKKREDIEKATAAIIATYRAAMSKADKDLAITNITETTNKEITAINESIGAMQKKGVFASQIEREKMKLIDAEKKQNEELHKKGLIDEATYQAKKTDLEKKGSDQRSAIKKADLDIAKQVGQKLIEMAKQVSDAIFENQKQQRDNELKEKLDHLAAQKDAELMNTTLTASQRKAIEKKYKMQEAREKENAWKADQKAKAEQAVINGLLAFTAALASSPPPMNYVNAAIALASAGIQAGIIMSKTPPKFAKGVVALEGPGTETSDSIPAYLSKGESVITASATRRYQPLLEAMNAGTLDRYMPLPQMPDVKTLETATRSSHRAQAEKIDYEKIGEALARRINMKQLNVTIDEKGFTKSVVRRGERITSYNDRMQF